MCVEIKPMTNKNIPLLYLYRFQKTVPILTGTLQVIGIQDLLESDSLKK